MRRLIINADDFGLTKGVNRAIVEAHTQGAVTSTTLMANGAALDDAVAQARSASELSIGCHVVLVDGAPVLDPASVPSLTANRANPGRFQSSISSFAARALAGGFDRDELVNEIVAQIRKLQGAGISVTHLDSHKHTHVFPIVLDALIRAARICGVTAIRNPFVPAHLLNPRQLAKHPRLWKRYGQVQMLRRFAPQFQAKIGRAGLAAPDGAVGVIETGTLDIGLLERALELLPQGTWELVSHPGYDDADLAAANTRLHQSREQERAWLVSTELHEFLLGQGFELIGYRALVAPVVGR